MGFIITETYNFLGELAGPLFKAGITWGSGGGSIGTGKTNAEAANNMMITMVAILALVMVMKN